MKRFDGALGRPSAKQPCGLRVGTDFSGLDVALFVLMRLGIGARHVFACDNRKAVRDFIQAAHSPTVMYEDITCRDIASTPAVDLYIFGPPCQTFSSAGSRSGTSDVRGQLWVFSLGYILHHKPSCVLFENVPLVATRFKPVLNVISERLRHAGYLVEWKILNTRDFGLPQKRERVYLQGVRQGAHQHPVAWPTELSSGIPLQRLVPNLRKPEWRAVPENPGAAGKVLQACGHMQQENTHVS